jgi:hypothetical protein
MKLYLVHCGFYDSELCQGIYESHVNFFVVAKDAEGARAKAKQLPDFAMKRMHVDGLQEIESVDGHRLTLNFEASLRGETRISAIKQRDLAPKPPAAITP